MVFRITFLLAAAFLTGAAAFFAGFFAKGLGAGFFSGINFATSFDFAASFFRLIASAFESLLASPGPVIADIILS
jgi:hypothetical protein